MYSVLLSIMIPATFYFTDNGSLYGTTTNGATFSQETIIEKPKIQKFHLDYESESIEWYITEDGVLETLQDLSKYLYVKSTI